MKEVENDNDTDVKSPEVMDVPSGAGEDVGEPGEVDELSVLRSELETKTAEVEENRNEMLRSRAELDNVRRRLEKEKADHISYGNERLIKELLGVMDNFERALEHAGEDSSENGVEALRGGIELIYGQMKTVLANFGLKEVEAVGAKFDPTVHEAISRDECPDSKPDTVIKEFQKGYFLKDRLLRPSMVSVAK